MINQCTADKLIEMRLTAMSDAFRIQMNDPKMKGIPFDDRFGLLVDVEYTSRKNNRLKRIIRNADFEQTDACSKWQAFFSVIRKGEFSLTRKGLFSAVRKADFPQCWKDVFSLIWKGEFSGRYAPEAQG